VCETPRAGGKLAGVFSLPVPEQSQLKNDGLVFGRSLQKSLKIASMYASVDHAAADMAAQQTYASLVPLLKQNREFTLGFVNQRLLLNNIILSGDNPLTALAVEFSKRGISAVSFSVGVTLKEFKRGLSLLSLAPKTLEKSGGLKHVIEQSPLQQMRIVPSSKLHSEGEDTVLAEGSESYLLAQGILEPQVGSGQGGGFELILQSLGAKGSGAGAGGGSEVLERAGKSVENVLGDPDGDLREAVTGLTRLFEQLTPDYLLASLTPARQSQWRGRSAQEMATDLVEDVVVESAGKRLTEAAPGPLPPAVVEEVMRALERGLRATRVAERLLEKLGRFIEEAKLPEEVNQHIRQEVVWFSLPETEKHAQLLRLERFGPREFRRLVNYARDRMKEGNTAPALEVTQHYFACLEKLPADVGAEHLARAPELVRQVSGPETLEFLGGLGRRLGEELEKPRDKELHRQVANSLMAVAQSAGLYEDFKLVQGVCVSLHNGLARDPAQHADCCGRALRGLLTSAVADRLVELYLEHRVDALWTKTVTSLLRLSGEVGGEQAFGRLVEEPAAPNRLRLIRLIEQLGAPAIQAARKRLGDERWYVVRNACYVLGNLADPELSTQLRAGLRHPEVRVQQAAVTAIIKNQVSNRAAVLAEALPYLQGQVLEMALDELTFLRDPGSVSSLEQFIAQKKGSKARGLEKAVRVLAALRSDRAVEVLAMILGDRGQAQSVRRAALVGLSCSPSPHAHRLMFVFSGQDPKDELVGECRSLLGVSQP
jgi:hypothetical protein